MHDCGNRIEVVIGQGMQWSNRGEICIQRRKSLFEFLESSVHIHPLLLAREITKISRLAGKVDNLIKELRQILSRVYN